MASQITSLTIINSTVYSGVDQRKHQSSASLAFVRGHQSPVNSTHKWRVTRKMLPFDDVIMKPWIISAPISPTCEWSGTPIIVNSRPICDGLRAVKVGMDSRQASSCVVMGPGNTRSDSWWRHQMETFSALLALCVENSPVIGEPAQRPVTRSFDVFFHLCLNKRLSKQ